MTTWNDRALECASDLFPEPEGREANKTYYPLEALREHKRGAFILGAAWQREQLLTDETVERAARALNTAGWTCVDGAHEPGDYDDCPYCRGTCIALARAALTAAIGDQS